ncbi:MAG: rhomboid family intramembrane serine protease [Treponema sp.]|nr:rhomboid family intramembrane serine protease [Treponema sp.]
MTHFHFLRKPFRHTFSNVSLLLIAINSLVFVALSFMSHLKVVLSLNPLYFLQGRMYWQILTYMFVHGNYQHIFFNMLAILVFGIPIERAVGSKEFTLMYFLFGIMSGVISLIIYIITGYYYVFLMGASGTVYGLLLAYAVIFPRSTIYVWGLVPIPAPLLVVIYACIELGSQIFSIGGGIAHCTHLAGLLVAWLYFIIRMGIHPLQVWKDAYR